VMNKITNETFWLSVRGRGHCGRGRSDAAGVH